MTSSRAWDPDFLTRSPAFDVLREAAGYLDLSTWPSAAALTRVASQLPVIPQSASGRSVAFVAPQSIESLSYEQRIYDQGEVACRPEDWHDLLNALVWMTYPRAKAALNARHVEEMAAEVPGKRGRTRDALTLFDEGGAIVCSSSVAMLDLVRNFQWKDLFWRRREEFRASTRVFIFGHAMYQKLLDPFLGVSALAILQAVPSGFGHDSLEEQIIRADSMTADVLQGRGVIQTPRELAPLPILGIPGWFAENSVESFYDNQNYFRPGRMRAFALAAR